MYNIHSFAFVNQKEPFFSYILTFRLKNGIIVYNTLKTLLLYHSLCIFSSDCFNFDIITCFNYDGFLREQRRIGSAVRV